ncbi:hypothetical protein QS306_16675 [Paraburkholderia bonniea]|uniref:hypothetical protein n=1 Tax=Paraburkholderia bonniea TaxID=2152891 RepID=UPI002572B7A3|nr:hypothetical protein [Paraburkholderia bonniea]WJF91705.1 hypothetical protein QS306_16675 [Paraburkholderia bonniea]WJF95025.1 hypothetical protein QS308_16680 [Paraburkholderia bonniea]
MCPSCVTVADRFDNTRGTLVAAGSTVAASGDGRISATDEGNASNLTGLQTSSPPPSSNRN